MFDFGLSTQNLIIPRKSLAVFFVAHILISISFPTFICLNIHMCAKLLSCVSL